MKRLMSIIIVGLFLLVCVTGCGNVGTKTITCVSEKVGKAPVIVYYEVYKVKNNEIVELEKYNIKTFDKEYLERVKLEDIIKIYEKDKDTKVEKLSDHELKIIDTNPTNVFKNSKSDNITELIINSMEKNDFSLYRYTCSVK